MRSRLLSLLLLLSLLGGCAAPVVIVGGVAAGAMVATDRRTAGAMLDDERIELKTLGLAAEDPILRDNAHVNATSYNGQLLLTGEVPDEQSRISLERQAARLERVQLVRNELVVGPQSDSTSRTADTGITRRVKTALIQKLGGGLASNIKVVTERGTVYLMGLISREEAAQAVTVVQHIAGVVRIVKVFEYQG